MHDNKVADNLCKRRHYRIYDNKVYDNQYFLRPHPGIYCFKVAFFPSSHYNILLRMNYKHKILL